GCAQYKTSLMWVRDFPIWRDINAIWGWLLQGLVWHVPRLNALLTTCDFVKTDGKWDQVKLSMVFPRWCVALIVNIVPSLDDNGDDKIKWRLEPNGEFTIKSAYKLLFESKWASKSCLWDVI
ncbi:hypothetical protein Ancab_014827, partial [Ancistrocladus abbreviatus]